MKNDLYKKLDEYYKILNKIKLNKKKEWMYIFYVDLDICMFDGKNILFKNFLIISL